MLAQTQKHVDVQIQPNPGLCMSAWREELADDYDAPFILQGIKIGFDIVDPSAVPEIVEIDNNISAQPYSKLYDQATTQIVSEIEQGNYEICTQNNKPAIISLFCHLMF